jgi:hypothetical protein
MAKKKVVSIEVSPLKDSDGQVEWTTPRKAEFWGVYLRVATRRAPDGLAEWVSDHKTRAKATAVARRLSAKYDVKAWVRK